MVDAVPGRRLTCDVLCKVVDNFGDAAVAWRLAQALARQGPFVVRLLIDAPGVLARLVPEAVGVFAPHCLDGIEVRDFTHPGVDAAEIVVETFGCGLPPPYVAALARDRHVWINVDYLSAEAWVESCHGLPSYPPQRLAGKSVRHFFFPGFSAATGGVLREPDLRARRDRFRAEAEAQQALWLRLGVTARAGERRLSMFTYASGFAPNWFARLARVTEDPLHILVAEGILTDCVRHFCGSAVAGTSSTQGALRVSVVPFVAQRDFDEILWACDLNVVRGEDSFVRAQLAGRPMLWDIYPQEDDIHLTKLDAFLARYCSGWPQRLQTEHWRVAHALVRRDADAAAALAEWARRAPLLERQAAAWADGLFALPELGDSVAQFALKLLK